jgi:phage terminase large subunit-like protein
MAGNRCGKTYCGSMEMAMHLTGVYPKAWKGKVFNTPIDAWAASVSIEATRDILQSSYLGDDDIAGCIPKNCIEHITYRRGVSGAIDTIYIKHISGGISTLGFKSYDQGREKFQGTSKDLIHLDEEPDIGIYEECLLRTLDTGGLIMLTMTPLKGLSEICQHFMQDTENKNKQIVQASWDDTNHLSKNEKALLRKSLRPHEIEAREKGIPSLGSGKIYPIKESEIMVDPFTIPDNYKKCFGMDFGWSNPTAVVWGAIDPETDILYIYDSYAVSEQSPAEHSISIKQRGEFIPGVCDPAGSMSLQNSGISLIDLYAKAGIYLTKADNSVEAGIMHVYELMKEGKIKVFSSLEPFWREFRLYRRNEKGTIVKKDDHLMDAFRYLVVSGLVLAKSKNADKLPILRRANNWVES